jgi:hypothetical protein
MQNPKRVVRISKKAAVFAGIILVLVIIAWVISKPHNRIYETGTVENVTSPEASQSSDIGPPGYPMPFYGGGNPSAKDTREFMKVYYNAEIKTRDVKDVTRDLKSAVRDANGRIDNLSETQKYAYINFVVSKSEFENFKEEIESLAHEKLIIENTSSSNLLGQKQSIEEEDANAKIALAELQKKLQDLNTSHAQAVKSLQDRLNANALELIRVRDAMAKTSDPAALSALKTQEANLIKNSSELTQNLNSENQSFSIESQNLKNQIENVGKQIENIAEQDEDFTDNVDTVSGSISVEWVSIWQLAKIFSPIHPIWEIIILLVVVWYLLKRKNLVPGIEFV